MMRKLIFLLILIIIFSIFSMSLLKKENKIILTGIIKIFGAEPFSEMIIKTNNNEIFYLTNDFKKNNSSLINKVVKLEAIKKPKVIHTTGKDFILKDKYELSDVKVIEIK